MSTTLSIVRGPEPYLEKPFETFLAHCGAKTSPTYPLTLTSPPPLSEPPIILGTYVYSPYLQRVCLCLGGPTHESSEHWD